LFLIAGICGDIVTSRAADAAVSLACAQDVGARRFELRRDGQDLRFSVSADAWIEIREARQTITITGTGLDNQIEIPLPLRFGSHWLQAHRGSEFQVKRFIPVDADGSFDLVVHCAVPDDLRRRIAWLERASHVRAKITAESNPQVVAEVLADARALAASAAGRADAALAQHLIAQTYLLNGRNADAAEAFAETEAFWEKAGNPDGALAARVGRIYALTQAGSNQAVIDATQPPELVHVRISYLLLRIEYDRCRSLQSLARLDEAERCYAWTLAGYHQLREDTEYIGALQAYATIKRDRGDFTGAQKLTEKSLREARGPYVHSIRGTDLLTLADLALRRGDVALSLQQLDEALREFTLFKSARWQADVYMKLADVYGELGSYDEAYAALAQALRRFRARDDAARVATALLSFADLERQNGRGASALLWSAAAEAMFRWLHVPARANTARVLAATLRVDQAGADAPELEPIESVPAEEEGKWRLLHARLALAQHRDQAARAELEALARMPLALSDRVQASVLEAERQAAGSDIVAAQETLLTAAAHIHTLAQHSRSDVLRYVIAREDYELRRVGMRLAIAQPRGVHEATADVWRWLEVEDDAHRPKGKAAIDAMPDEAFGRAVANELLVAPGDVRTGVDATAQRELLARLAASDQGSGWRVPSMPTMSLAQFQAALPDGCAFIAYADGGMRGALLWLTHDEAQLLPAAAPDQLRSDILVLQSLAKDVGAALADVQAAARRVSDDLLGGFDAPPPRRLYVLAGAFSRGIPWTTLPWPRTTAPLVESTAVAVVRLSRELAASHAALPSAHEIRVVVSAQSGGSALPVLPGAKVEAAQIRGAASAHNIRVVEDPYATRDAVSRAFEQPGAWIHIAAHGMAQPERIGYAGLWLEPASPDTTPAFLSWIDVLDKGVRSDLVVLDACQTGDSGTAVSGNLSFADAVSRAGASRVVAVMWPISDAASSIWVPTFYATLAGDRNHDAAEALRIAQQQLRASRAFSHPFYWAGMQAIERWPIGVNASH
jgi:tetratricopeptide (TPR) repeat protein